MTDKLNIAKEIIKNNIDDAKCGIFDCNGTDDAPVFTLYEENGLRIDVCYYYSYFEVFGLTDKEFDELEKYYERLRKKSYAKN